MPDPDDNKPDDDIDDDTIGDPGDGDDDNDDGDGDDDDKDAGAKKALERERARVKRLKERLSAAEKRATSAPSDDDKVKAAEQAGQQADAKWKPRVIKQAARGALAEAGAMNPQRLVGLLKIDDLEVDDDGEVDGLEDEIDRLKDEFPELFRKKRAAPLETGDRSAGKGAGRPKSDSQRQADAILGRQR